MRDKTVRCGTCAIEGQAGTGICYMTANLDTGRVTKCILPPQCKWPSSGRCAEEHKIGIFSRPFGSKIIRTKDF